MKHCIPPPVPPPVPPPMPSAASPPPPPAVSWPPTDDIDGRPNHPRDCRPPSPPNPPGLHRASPIAAAQHGAAVTRRGCTRGVAAASARRLLRWAASPRGGAPPGPPPVGQARDRLPRRGVWQHESVPSGAPAWRNAWLTAATARDGGPDRRLHNPTDGRPPPEVHKRGHHHGELPAAAVHLDAAATGGRRTRRVAPAWVRLRRL